MSLICGGTHFLYLKIPVTSEVGTTKSWSCLSQTSFGHISINSLTILTVSIATESPQKDLLVDASYISRQSIFAEILSRSTGNHHVTIY